MGHVEVDAYIRGTSGGVELKRVIVDTGATYTVLPIELVKEIGAVETPYTVDMELGDGRKIKTNIYVASIKIQEREAPSIIAAFKEAKIVIGVQSLEALGLKVDPTTGKLEPTRPKGLAYFYSLQINNVF